MDLDINNLDFSDVGNWPLSIKAAAVIIICIATLVGGYFTFTQKQLEEKDSLVNKEIELQSVFTSKQAKAVNLEAYQKQLAEMKLSFGTMLKQLPGKTEVAELLVDISQTGLASGLEFELFKPEGERPVEFYAELPIKLRVTGSYHEFGQFVSGVAALPRIVTLHDFSISAAGKGKGGDLMMEATAKTYRYLDDSEQEQQANN
ncbi:MAG: type 4a pilus biogenesis protein PilO [Gammaproteobacteria bacterium]|nr:MAG: type 4a pilus biogenesis protein PilO [Gammaproteobacteria bacterium]